MWNYVSMQRTWPDDWEAQRQGLNCEMCAEGRPDIKQGSFRVFKGKWADAYLKRRPAQPGSVVIVFRGLRHVPDISYFTDEEKLGYWGDVSAIAKAIEEAYKPCQLNYSAFNNTVAHVHTHITPRYADDPAPCRPLPDYVFANPDPLTDEQLTEQIAHVRRYLPDGSL